MSFLDAIQGENPSKTQLIGSYGVGLLASGLVLLELGLGWKAILLALLMFDWVGGIVANSAISVREWWHARPGLCRSFIPLHLLELPLVYWLTGGGPLFLALVLVLAVKLFVFELGLESLKSRAARTEAPEPAP